MTQSRAKRNRAGIRVTHARAARLHRLLRLLVQASRGRDELRAEVGIGLRTFYRELDLIRRCGIRIRLEGRRYVLSMTLSEAEGRLPFPDPQLTFAEMTELAAGLGPASARLAELLSRAKAETPGPRKPSRRTDTRQ